MTYCLSPCLGVIQPSAAHDSGLCGFDACMHITVDETQLDLDISKQLVYVLANVELQKHCEGTAQPSECPSARYALEQASLLVFAVLDVMPVLELLSSSDLQTSERVLQRWIERLQ